MEAALVCDKPHTTFFLFLVFCPILGFCAVVSRSMRAGSGGGGMTAGTQKILLMLSLLFLSCTIFPLFPYSLHPYLLPIISRAVQITCPLARAHHQFHDSLHVASIMAAALIESKGRVRLCLRLDTVICAQEMTSEGQVNFFSHHFQKHYVCLLSTSNMHSIYCILFPHITHAL